MHNRNSQSQLWIALQPDTMYGIHYVPANCRQAKMGKLWEAVGNHLGFLFEFTRTCTMIVVVCMCASIRPQRTTCWWIPYNNAKWILWMVHHSNRRVNFCQPMGSTRQGFTQRLEASCLARILADDSLSHLHQVLSPTAMLAHSSHWTQNFGVRKNQKESSKCGLH